MTQTDATMSNTMRPTTIITIIAMYTGTCVGGGYMLTLIPNIEIFSMKIGRFSKRVRS